ncbi:LADA_0H05798g1_1 [Lachancea dasiensis]|uniref:LADA_0H05798g1_1 n=1 Tax=Lachancea dasiensis TaxID=1072105 RepID=A0A1G4K1K3_9SACH|nr:LADA_0H05798g1_1 [Lachancea dasiensis]
MPQDNRGPSNCIGTHSPLDKWNSCSSHLNAPERLPKQHIRSIHIYDFDNTLFKSPAPNPNLLSSFLTNLLTDPQRLSNGGWWSEPRFLEELVDEWIALRSSTSNVVEQEGIDDGYWNRDIVELCRLSHKDPHTLSILMTGRKEAHFEPTFKKVLDQPIFGSDKLHFNAVCLKKDGFKTTMLYKTACLTDLLVHYDRCDAITIYDDRPRQLHGFRQFLNEFVEAMRPSLQFNLVHVPGIIKFLKPSKERHIITEIFKEHNDAVSNAIFQPSTIKEQHFYMGKMFIKEKRLCAAYVLTTASRQELAKYFVSEMGHLIDSNGTRIAARSIPCTQYGTITTRKIATMIISGCRTEPTEEIIEKIMQAMNSGVEKSRIRFRISRFGISSSGDCVCDLEPEDEKRYTYTEFATLRLLVATAGRQQDIDTTSNLYVDELFEWRSVEEPAPIIETDFGYVYALTAIMAKKAKKSRRTRPQS